MIAALDDHYWVVRRDVAKALGKLGDARAVDPLTKLQGDTNDRVKAAAVAALQTIAEMNAEPM